MKKVFTLFVKVFSIFTFILTSTIGFSQEINEVEFLTSDKWYVSSVKVGDEIQNYSEKTNWMYFHADGTYEIVMNENEKEGRWKFDEQDQKIKFIESSNVKSSLEIKVLNEKEFVFVANQNGLIYKMELKR